MTTPEWRNDTHFTKDPGGSVQDIIVNKEQIGTLSVGEDGYEVRFPIQGNPAVRIPMDVLDSIAQEVESKRAGGIIKLTNELRFVETTDVNVLAILRQENPIGSLRIGGIYSVDFYPEENASEVVCPVDDINQIRRKRDALVMQRAPR